MCNSVCVDLLSHLRARISTLEGKKFYWPVSYSQVCSGEQRPRVEFQPIFDKVFSSRGGQEIRVHSVRVGAREKGNCGSGPFGLAGGNNLATGKRYLAYYYCELRLEGGCFPNARGYFGDMGCERS